MGEQQGLLEFLDVISSPGDDAIGALEWHPRIGSVGNCLRDWTRVRSPLLLHQIGVLGTGKPPQDSFSRYGCFAFPSTETCSSYIVYTITTARMAFASQGIRNSHVREGCEYVKRSNWKHLFRVSDSNLRLGIRNYG